MIPSSSISVDDCAKITFGEDLFRIGWLAGEWGNVRQIGDGEDDSRT